MGVFAGRRAVTDGLIFSLDHDDPKSFVGAPTTNHAYLQNARDDDSYVTYENTSSGTWPDNHADAITVYNDSGTNISNYVNTGVGDYTNTQHGIWTYDDILKRPVVTLRDWDSQWKAKHFGGIPSMTSMGLASTDNYTISWLQWVDNTSKSANVGLYGLNNVAANGFHDGLAHAVNQSTTQNTKTHTWEKVHCTFTVASDWDFTDPLNCYMYGNYNPDGTVKIVDVQVEANNYMSGFSKANTRSSTEALVDTVGGNTITATSLTYSDDAFSFNGSSDYMEVAALGLLSNFTVIAWIKPSSHPADSSAVVADKFTTAVNFRLGYNGTAGTMVGGFYNGTWRLSPTTTTTIDTWQCVATSYDGADITIYKNGVSGGSTGYVGSTTTDGNGFRIGRRWDSADNFPGDIHVVQIYNRALSASEVLQNFNAMKGRFGV